MRTPTLDDRTARELPDHLETHLQEWVDHELITPDEVRRIVGYETEHGPSRRIPLVAEIVGYLGAILVIAAGIVAFGLVFDELSHAMRVAVPAVAAAVACGAGVPLVRNRDATFRRLGAVLWTGSVGLVAFALGVVVLDREVVPTYAGVLIGGVCLVYAATLYGLIRHGALQLAIFASAITTAVSGIAWLTSEDPSEIPWAYALALLVLGVVWVIAGERSWLGPSGEALFLGAGLALIAPTLLMADETGIALILGIALAAGLLAAATWLRSTPMLVLSGIALFFYMVSGIGQYLAESIGAPLALALSGLMLIAVAIVVSRLRRFTRSDPAPRTSGT
jgi:hypothetical protein